MHTSQGKGLTTLSESRQITQETYQDQYVIIKVVTPSDPDITTINQLQYTGVKLIRQDIFIITEYTNGSNSTNIKRKLKKIMRMRKSPKNIGLPAKKT